MIVEGRADVTDLVVDAIQITHRFLHQRRLGLRGQARPQTLNLSTWLFWEGQERCVICGKVMLFIPRKLRDSNTVYQDQLGS